MLYCAGRSRNGLYSPLGIETLVEFVQCAIHRKVGMAFTARWGLKQKVVVGKGIQLIVGMAFTARWGLKHQVRCAEDIPAMLAGMAFTARWGLKRSALSSLASYSCCRNGLYSPLESRK